MEPVGLGIKPQSPFQSIGEVLGIAGKAQGLQQGAQQIQQGAVQLEQSQLDLAERHQLMQLGKDIAQYTRPDGNLDAARLLQKATSIAPKLGLSWAKDALGAHLEGLNVKNAILSTDEKSRQQAGGILVGVKDAPPEVQTSILGGAKKQYPELAPAFDWIIKAAPQTPQERSAYFEKMGIGMQSIPVQSEVTTPSGPVIPTGQQNIVTNLRPFAGPKGAILSVQQEIPPTATTPTPSGQQTYVGPRAPSVPVGTAPSAGAPPAPIASAAPPTLASTVEMVGKNFQEVQDSAKTAGQDIGVLQNIKKYAPGAVTGVESDRRAYIAGIAGLLGIEAGQIGKTATDLLIKNANMQALGGNTDAARILLEGANPNVKMTKEAIVDAANQVIAQRRMALQKQRILGDVKGAVDSGRLPPNSYTDTVTKLNAIDPRVLQLSEMSKAEKQKLMDSMTDAQKKTFVNMVREAHKMGVGNE